MVLLSWHKGFYYCSWMIVMLIINSLAFIRSDEQSHKYVDGESVLLWFNNVGSKANPLETYDYFSLPYCTGSKIELSKYHPSISERLLGIEHKFSGMDIQFNQNFNTRTLCATSLNKTDAQAFIDAISKDFWYQLFVDDLNYELPVGIVNNSIASIFLHRSIVIFINKQRIISINITVSDPVAVEPNVLLSFTYEVFWTPTSVEFADRHDFQYKVDSIQHKIHWFSIVNSFVMVIFMIFFVYLILSRLLRQDIAIYNREKDFIDLEQDLLDEFGWKQVRGDVFRYPAYPMALSIVLGSGAHVGLTAFLCIAITILAELYTKRTSMLSAFLFLYAMTTPINGFYGGSKYMQWKGLKWIRQCILSTLFFPTLVCFTQLFINILATCYNSSRSVPIVSAISVLCIIGFVMMPLGFVGTIIGRAMNGEFITPCRVNPIPRPIPDKKWYLRPWSLIIFSGLLPAGSAFIEVYFIFTSFWGYKFYYMFDFMFFVFIILILVTMLSSVICTYFLLNSEDYRWHWMAFLSGSSIAIYLYIFSIYYFVYKTRMNGMFQTSFYFAYTIIFCVIVGLMCGCAAYLASSMFVLHIYKSIKAD